MCACVCVHGTLRCRGDTSQWERTPFCGRHLPVSGMGVERLLKHQGCKSADHEGEDGWICVSPSWAPSKEGPGQRGVRAQPAGGPVTCRTKQNVAQEWGPRSDCLPVCRPDHLASPPPGLPPLWSFEEPSGSCPQASALGLGLRAVETVSGRPLPGSVDAPGPGPGLRGQLSWGWPE